MDLSLHLLPFTYHNIKSICQSLQKKSFLMFTKKDHIGPKTFIFITSLTNLACQGGVVFVFWLARSSQGVFVFVIVFVILSLSFDLSSSLHSPWVLLSGWQLHSASAISASQSELLPLPPLHISPIVDPRGCERPSHWLDQ